MNLKFKYLNLIIINISVNNKTKGKTIDIHKIVKYTHHVFNYMNNLKIII